MYDSNYVLFLRIYDILFKICNNETTDIIQIFDIIFCNGKNLP